MMLLLLLVNSLSGPSMFVFQHSKVLFFKFPAVLLSVHRSFSDIFSDVLVLRNNYGASFTEKLSFRFELLESNYRERC